MLVKKIAFIFLLYFYSSLIVSNSYNSIGQVGLINTPSAENKGEQSIYFTVKRNSFTKLGTLTVTPFDWLEASYFYYRPDDIVWGGKVGSDLDKGFNVKFSYKPENIYLPRLAVGLDDFAGTGRFTKEYLVATYDLNRIKISSGVGWGMFVGDVHVIQNPLAVFSESFNNRSDVSRKHRKGGNPATDKWFKGDAVVFGGIEMYLDRKKRFSIKVESNPFDYFKFGRGVFSEKSFDLRQSDANYNIGASYKFSEFGNIDLSYIKGNTINLSISFGFSSKKPLRKKNKFNPSIKNSNYGQSKKDEFYRDLLENLNNNNLYLQSANLDEENLSITIDTELFNPIQYSSRTAYIANKVLDFNNIEINNIDVGLVKRGMEINNITYRVSDISNEKTFKVIAKNRSQINNINPTDYKKDEFRPLLKFPIIYSSIEPDIETHIGSPERFLFWGLGVRLSNEIQFNRNLTMTSVIAQSLSNTFDEKDSNPDSKMERVRTEILDYLQQSDDIFIKNLQIDYINSFRRNTSFRVGIGYLEKMYGGFTSEILYKPFDKNFAISAEYNRVKKRNYDGRFNFLDYQTTTAHVNSAYYIPSQNILIKLSIGQYLAGDKGYTLDISRRMPSGWSSGFYFSRTNVSPELFGEGSFDKGFYIRVPFNIFTKNYQKDSVNFSMKTLTRDGGQKLEINNRLIDSFYGSSKNEINENWHNYLD